MTDYLLEFGVSNLFVSVVLAAIAWSVQSMCRQPLIAHLLWMIVLAKLITPSVLTVPWIEIPGSSAATVADAASVGVAAPTLFELESLKSGLILLWLIGSAGVLIWTMVRICRFHRLLTMSAEPASPELQRIADGIAHSLGLRVVPKIFTTSARLSPMVWWVGGRVRVVLPAALRDEMDASQLRWILAHELAHVRRRDHLVRWLEWLACVGFWWNPIAWWARRNLRAHEEVCCDALVLECLDPQPTTYAQSLLTVVEFLASPVLRPPAMASEINSGGFLERRFRMILSTNPSPKTPRWLRAGIVLCAVWLLPLGVAQAQSAEQVAAGKKIKAAVKAGKLTKEEAKAKLKAMKKAQEAKSKKAGAGAKKKGSYGAAKENGYGTKKKGGYDTKSKAKAGAKQENGYGAGKTKKKAKNAFGGDVKYGKEKAYKKQDDYGKKLKAAVKAGKLTEKQAKKKYDEMKKKKEAEKKKDN